MINIKKYSNFDLNAHKVKVLGTGVFFPNQRVFSDDLFEEIKSDQQYGVPKNWMSRFLGIKERRMASPDTTPSEIAIPAAQMAIDNCQGLNPDHIDSVYFCGIERDYPEPATAHIIQSKLGLSARNAVDISNACFGFVNGIEAAIKDIKLGESRFALVVTGEVSTRVLRVVVDVLKAGVSLDKAKLLLGALSVGDAGGAIILGPSSPDEETGFSLFNKQTDSSKNKLCYYSLEGGEPKGQMDMKNISKDILKVHKSMIGSTLHNAGRNEFDWGLCHQTSAIQFARIAKMAKVAPNNMIKTFPNYGNVTTASFAVGFDKLQKNANVNKGDKIAGCFSGSGLTIGQFVYTY